MWELLKLFGDFFLTVLVVSTLLMFIRNKRIRDTLGAIVGVLALFWFLVVLIFSVGAAGSLAAGIALLLFLCLLMFLVHDGSKALSARAHPPKP